MNQRELEKEGVDLKLVLLLLLKKIPHIILAMLAGAILSGGVYWCVHSAAVKNRQYEAESKYYITFSETMEKSYLDYYYNGYTWNDLLSSDPVLGYAMTLLPDDYGRTYVDGCVEAEILSDVRVLTTTVTADTPDEVRIIQNALEQAVVHYGTVGENLEQIAVIRSDEPAPVEIANHLIRAAISGGVFFLLFAALLLLLQIAVSNAVYLPEEFEKRYHIPVAGMRLKDGAADGGSAAFRLLEGELAENLKQLTKTRDYPVLSMQDPGEIPGELYEKIRSAGGVILEFPQGKQNSKKLERLLRTLKLQDCPVVCAVMTQTDISLVSMYYHF